MTQRFFIKNSHQTMKNLSSLLNAKQKKANKLNSTTQQRFR